MKYLTTAVLLFLFSATFNQPAAQNKSWIEVSRDVEFFRVSMPNQPKEEFQTKGYGDLNVSGTWYEAGADGASYAVWAFVHANHKSTDDPDTPVPLDVHQVPGRERQLVQLLHDVAWRNRVVLRFKRCQLMAR